MSKLEELADLGQAVWIDHIRRSFIVSGQLQALIDLGLRGVTSNPSIFEKAIVGSADYDEDLRRLVAEDRSAEEIYEALAFDDIRGASDLMRPVYERTRGKDGFVSLEVSPGLAHDAESTIAEAKRLFAALDRPNVMIKVPATPAGLPAVEALIGDGVNVNVTLIFSLAQYEAAALAYIAGLERLAAAGGDLSRVGSVASFFVSRVDTAVDRALEALGETDLQGKNAVDNARLAYSRGREIFRGERWRRLAAGGARVQRLLWASTGTKNALYPDTLYVDTLIGPETVNTMPLATLRAFLDHGRTVATVETDLDGARSRMRKLADLGIDLEAVTRSLQEEGVAAFGRSFDGLMAGIAEKRERLLVEWQAISAELGPYQETVEAAAAEMRDERILARVWAHDHTVWAGEPSGIVDRLGWLQSPEVMMEAAAGITSWVDQVRGAGYTRALLLGMGGSSLAAAVFRQTFGVREGYLDLSVLDSTDPGAVREKMESIDPAKALFVVSTKSGGTVETMSFMRYFYNRTMDSLGASEAGRHFVAITDPGSPLVSLAERLSFRKTFLNDPHIGGRYSALSHFGLVPAALIGVDLAALLERALTMACNCESCNCPVAGDNCGARLGVVMGELAKAGRDKLTLLTTPAIASFGDWVEQLIAESTGKDSKGILPVVGEPIGPPGVYGSDRLFVSVRLEDDRTDEEALRSLEDAGHPVVRLRLRDLLDLGGQFFLWEMATALAGSRLDINPFDQPNVEAAKVRAKEMVAAYQREGELPKEAPRVQADGIAVYTDDEVSGLSDAIRALLGKAEAGAYVAIQAYVQPTPENDAALSALRDRVRDRYRLATTVGYGPRFLHSTGQLHKGDAGKGLFIQVTGVDREDVPIPDEPGSPRSSMTFGVLKMAQALGDRQALLDAGRRVIRVHLGADVSEGLTSLSEAVG